MEQHAKAKLLLLIRTEPKDALDDPLSEISTAIPSAPTLG